MSTLSIVAGCVLVGAAICGRTPAILNAQNVAGATRISWTDISPLRGQLESRGLTAASFPAYVERLRQSHASRVRLGDLDHLVFYLLQSKGFTSLPSIEPALSAKALVDGLTDPQREAFLHGGELSSTRVPDAVRARIERLLVALGAPTRDARLIYFGELVKATFADSKEREPGLVREYLRVMRFVYEKEFVAQRSPRPADAVADLYRSRGLSTDTAVEAGYVVSIGLAILKSLEPDRRIRRVLIVGPGLDLAPRTALLEAGPPESYQPWAVMDALVSHGLARVRRARGGGRRHQSTRGIAPAARARLAANTEPRERDTRQRDGDARRRVPRLLRRAGPGNRRSQLATRLGPTGRRAPAPHRARRSAPPRARSRPRPSTS